MSLVVLIVALLEALRQAEFNLRFIGLRFSTIRSEEVAVRHDVVSIQVEVSEALLQQPCDDPPVRR